MAHCLRGLTAFAGAMFPLVVCWLGIVLGIMRPWEPSSAPNPAKAPIWMLGPMEALVYLDPWFAGTILFWEVPCVVVLCGCLTWATGVFRTRKPSVIPVILVSLVAGLVIAIPWLYAVTRYFTRGLN